MKRTLKTTAAKKTANADSHAGACRRNQPRFWARFFGILKAGLSRRRGLAHESAERRPAVCQEGTNHQLDLMKGHQRRIIGPTMLPAKSTLAMGTPVAKLFFEPQNKMVILSA